MGRNKALLPFRGTPLIARQLEILGPLFERVLIAGNDSGPYRKFAVDVVPAVLGGRRALTGIHAVLSASKTEHAFVVACDLPFLNAALIETLLNARPGNDVVVPESNGQIQPLHAVYSRKCIAAIEKSAREGAWKVSDFFSQVRVRRFPVRADEWLIEGRSPFFNANTPAEWDAAGPE